MQKGQADSGNRIPIEGPKLVREALRSHLIVEEVYLCASRAQESELEAIRKKTVDVGANVWLVADRVYRSLVDTETPQGVVAMVKLPKFQLDQVARDSSFLILADQLQDPGNLGTLVRSAEAFGAKAILLTENTVSPANQKVVRASAGSLFRIPILTGFKLPRLLDDLHERAFMLAATVPRGGQDFRHVDYRGPTALVVGNEGSGLSSSALERIRLRVTIPLSANVESLNVAVASSIIFSEVARQRGISAVKSEGTMG
jgi:RNA methyltransferase, TrmH family